MENSTPVLLYTSKVIVTLDSRFSFPNFWDFLLIRASAGQKD